MARIETVRLVNFASYRGEHVLDLRGKDIVGIYGDNRSGKSTLLDAVLCALYGYSRAGRSLEKMMTHGECAMEIEVVFDGAPENVTVKRGWSGGRGSVTVSGWEGAQSKDANAALVRWMGMSREDFMATRYFAQGDAQRFANASPSERRSIVESWVVRAVWSELYSTAHDKWRDAERAATRVDARHEHLTEAVREEVDDVDEELEAELEAAEEARQEAAEAYDAYLVARPTEGDDLKEARSKLFEARSNVRDAEADCTDFDGTCPVTLTLCGSIAAVRSQTTAMETRVELLHTEARKLEAESQRLNEEHDQAVIGWTTEGEELRSALRVAETCFGELREQIGAQRARVEEHERKRQQLEETTTELNVVRERLAALTYVRHMLGSTGIPTAEVEQALEHAEVDVNAWLASVGLMYRVRFRHFDVLKTWAAECAECGGRERSGVPSTCDACGAAWTKARRNTLGVNIVDGDEELDFALESGGCRDGASMAIRFAFARNLGSALRLAMCDEVFRQFDRNTRQSVAQHLLGEGLRGMGFNQVLCVSHDPGAVATAPHLLHVVRENGDSRFEWER